MKRRPTFEEIGEAGLGGHQSGAPALRSFREYLATCARVPLRGGSYGPFSFAGRAPLEFITDLVDQVLANCLHGQAAEIDGVGFAPGRLKGAVLTVGGGAQFGKTVTVLNFQAYCTFVEFVNFGYYTPDQQLLAKIVDSKFRPDVIEQQPWMREMIEVGRVETAKGIPVNRKNSYKATDGERRAFGHFCGMQKPPTAISLDAAALDEVDDIPAKNLGFVDGRMTASPLQFKFEIGTQRIAGAGQNARVQAGSFHVRMYHCAECQQDWNLEEEFPRIIRVAQDGAPKPADPSITAELGHDRDAHYYCACPDCGRPIERDSGRYVAKRPHRIKDAHLSVRVSQLNISAISLQEIVGAWYAAMQDPSGQALVAFYCDRIGIPNAGAAQPITQTILDRSRALGLGPAESPEPYAMSLAPGGGALRVAGLDMGPRCWFWCDEILNGHTSALVWAELIASGHAPARVPLLMHALGVACIFLDAGGEPDLTKRIVLALNGLEDYTPPVRPRNDLLKSHLWNLGAGLRWDGERGRWSGIKAAAVLFTSAEAKGIEQTIGFTQDGRIYPLLKCHRGESLQAGVNDFLTPAEGVLELAGPDGAKKLRAQPRARLPQTCIGPGVSLALLDGHLLNLRKERDPNTGMEDWVDKVENHLGLAKIYARLAALHAGETRGVVGRILPPSGRRAELIAERRDRRVLA